MLALSPTNRRRWLSFASAASVKVLASVTLAVAAVGCSGPEGSPDPQPAPEQAAAPDGDGPAVVESSTPAATGDRAGSPPPDQPGKPGGNGPLDDLAREMGLRDQEQRAISQHYFKTGLRYYEDFDYRKAAENFKKAVDADPNNVELRQYWLQASLLAGDRQPEFETVAEIIRKQREVSVELEKSELKRIYEEGEELLKRQEFARAVTRFEQVLEKIRWFPYKIDGAGYEESARRYIVQARRQQRERELSETEARERRAQAEAEAEQERYRREREAQVEILLKKAVEQLSVRRFDAAEGTIREVLEKDPGNEEAIKLRQMSIEHRHLVKEDRNFDENAKEHDSQLVNQGDLEVPYFPYGRVEFPDKDRWMMIRARDVGIAQAETREPEWIKDYKQVLKSRKVTLNFPETPFGEVVSFLQDITGLNITVSPQVDQEQTTVSLRLKDIPLEDAMKLILEQTKLAMVFQNETLLITPPEEARGQYDLEIYDVQDLLSKIPDFPGETIEIRGNNGGAGGGGGSFSFDTEEEQEGTVLDPDKLTEIVTNSVGEDKWDEPASIEAHRGQLIVNQTREIHAGVREVLRNLRRNTGLFVQVETRFINMTDDFLRDIGVDFRGMGVSPNPTFGHNPPLTLDPNIPTSNPGTGRDMGFGRQIPAQGNARASRLGPLVGPIGNQQTLFGSSMFGGRTENILNGGNAYFGGDRLNNTSVAAQNNPKGLAAQIAVLDPFQVNAIIRAEEENARRKIVQCPVITAANRQRVHVSVVTQRAYIADYELSSGGTGNVVAEVADPIIATFQEGIILDVRPTISADRKYITLDVRPTLATLVGGQFQQIQVNLGTISNAAINVNIEVPQITLQQAFTSVTLPDGGTALLGGFRKLNQKEEHSGVPFIDHVPLLNKVFSREAELNESLSLLVLVTARMISVRDEEAKRYNLDKD